jgi:hypothetical protein
LMELAHGFIRMLERQTVQVEAVQQGHRVRTGFSRAKRIRFDLRVGFLSGDTIGANGSDTSGE